MRIKYKSLRLAAAVYAALPVLIFFIGWLNAAAAAVFSALLILGVVFLVRGSKEGDLEKEEIVISKKCFLFLAATAFLWCVFAGQGGFFHQTDDHAVRNAILRDLIEKPWPVVYGGDKMLSYYIAHWMIPALFGKAAAGITGSPETGASVGNAALLIWSFAGCLLVFLLTALLTSEKNKKPHPVAASLMFVFFSGLDIVGGLLRGTQSAEHLEWWCGFFQFSSMSTCLFWVYNQTIAVWLITLCILNERKTKNFAFLGMLALPFGPLPFIGIVLLCLIKAAVIFVGAAKEKVLKENIIVTFSPQNILALAAIFIPYYFYYFSNAVAANEVVYAGEKADAGFRFHSAFTDSLESGNFVTLSSFLSFYLLFMLLEAAVFVAAILWLQKKRKEKIDPFFISAMCVLCVIPLFQIGLSKDFSMRVSIPFLTLLAVRFIGSALSLFPEKSEKRGRSVKNNCAAAVFAVIFLIGAVTPLKEFCREAYKTITIGPAAAAEHSLEDFPEIFNFTAPNFKESRFYKYFSKEVPL